MSVSPHKSRCTLKNDDNVEVNEETTYKYANRLRQSKRDVEILGS